MRDVIVSFSGGKDSTVAALEAIKHYGKERVQLVFMDTGAEYKGTTSHVNNIASILELPLTILKPKRDWFEQVEHDNFPFTPALRKCTYRLKIDVIRSWLSKYKRGLGLKSEDIITVTGIRGEESLSRSKLKEWDYDDHGQGKLWRPCLYMRKQEIKDRILSDGLPLHYCYEFSDRCNCWLCIFAGNYEIQSYIERCPEDYEKACEFEERVKFPILSNYRKIQDIIKQGRLF